MKEMFLKLVANYPYVISFALFAIGAVTVLTRSNLIKKLIGINIMESAIFLLFVASAYIRRAKGLMYTQDGVGEIHINPLPSALMLTGIVVSVSVTAFALALIVRLYNSYGTTSLRKIEEIRSEVKKND